MNASPFLQPRFSLSSYFVYRSGIPLLVFLYCLSLIADPSTIMMTAIPVFWFLHHLVGKRAVEQPFWLLTISAASIPAAALSSCWANLIAADGAGLESALGRSRVVAEFQKDLEVILTVPTTCCLLLAFLFLWAVCSTLKQYLDPPVYLPKEKWRVRRSRVVFLFSVLGLCVLLALAFPALADLKKSLKRSGWKAMPDARTLSFTHPALHGRSWGDIDFDAPGEPLAVHGEALSEIHESVAHDLCSRQFKFTQFDTFVLWKLFRQIDRTEPGDRGTAMFVAAVLAHNRHWDLGCTEQLTFAFRTHTLAYLASTRSTAQEHTFLQRLSPHLVVHDKGGRERQDIARLNRTTRELILWDVDWNTSLPLLYYALDNRVFPPHEPLPPEFNPELEALETVISIRKEQMKKGELPAHFSVRPELGYYQRTSPNKGHLFLTEIDPTCRPQAVVEFGPY